ncbi:vomeronasal 1 receptor ornAnaV1R3235 [Ornithorhynchus anatinus]|uniref:Vomeronasal type-1 receptor n=1 Tax=Ornithorhynchus anatinus TaxID=9258 RepID=A0A6I8N8M1_ORNAN|nr:vomeronasal 1 receptor ornAnaV1R3235 [Ornithorhynchus anatinus]
MDGMVLSFGLAILLQISIGSIVNVFLLLFYASVISASHKPSSPDLILAHLALANTIILLTYGIPEALSAWGWRNFLDAVVCKILFYLYRVARGLVISSTCLLSVFQAITISPGTSWLAGAKAKLPQCIVPFCAFSWLLNMLIDVTALIYMTGPQNSSSVRLSLDLKYCSTISASEASALAVAVALALRDLFFVGLMTLTSGYMVLILYRHHQQVRHIHGTSRSSRAMPEVTAAKRVITLVTFYVLLYGRQTIMLSILINMKGTSPLLMNIHMVLGFAFSVISPFLMIMSDRRMGTFWRRGSPGSKADPS